MWLGVMILLMNIEAPGQLVCCATTYEGMCKWEDREVGVVSVG